MLFFKSLYFNLILLIIFVSIKCKVVRHPFDIFSPHITFIESHRGVNREIFQNTRESISRAIQYDIESFETDVWLSKDNVLVILHGGNNGDLEGYYDHPGKVTELTWDELSTYRTVEDNLKMPRLDDIMALTKDKIFMNLEIKDPRIDLVFPYVIELIEKYNFFDQMAISSYHFEYYDKIEEYNKNHENKIIFGFLYNANSQDKFDYTKKGHTLNIHWTDASKEVCDKAHENGMAVLAWFGMKNEENTQIYENLIKNGVDSIICNVPLLARKFRDNYYFNVKKD